MYRQLIHLVEHLGRPRIAVVGDLMVDRYVFGDAERVSPEAPVQILKAASEEVRLGGAGSVVNNLLALGARASVFGVVGADADGRWIAETLRTSGARTAGVLTTRDRPTTIKTRFVGRAQHRHPQQVLRVDREETHAIPRAVEDRLLARLGPAIKASDAVILSDYNKGVLTPRLTQAIIRLARAARVPVLADPIKAPDYAKYRGATLLTPNRMETELASGIPLTSPDAVRRAARTLIDRLALDGLIVTLDKDGAYLAMRGKAGGEMVPTRPRLVYDVAGAGDMVIAVVAVAMAAGAPIIDAVRLANVAGGLEVEKFGVQTVSREEIVADLLNEARMSGDKVRSLKDLLFDLARHRSMGKSIAFTNGCFDIIHAGHIDYLEFSAKQGDVLVVGLNSDRSIRANKGPDRPICTEAVRARVLAALQAVDYVVVFDEDTPTRLIQAVRPDALIKGEDWRYKGVVGREFVESYGGRVILAPLVKGLSTTAIVGRIRAAQNGEPAAPAGSAAPVSKSKPRGAAARGQPAAARRKRKGR